MVEYGEKQWDKKRPEVDLLVEAEMGLSLGLHLVYGKIPNFPWKITHGNDYHIW